MRAAVRCARMARRLRSLALALLAAAGFQIQLAAGATAAGAAHEVSDSKLTGSDKTGRHCPEKHDPNGDWKGSTAPGKEYVLTCKEGFAVDNQPKVTLICSEEDLQWNADPWCMNVDDCEGTNGRRYGCGPAGHCKDGLGFSECVCEAGASNKTMPNGEVYCQFGNESQACGGRSCGAHGFCVDLEKPQPSFDSGSNSYRCSCDLGYFDDGEECKPVECGELVDPHGMGKWSGEARYQGQYTLMCKEGAHVKGTEKRAITVSCPPNGHWNWEMFGHKMPLCVSPTEQEHEARVAKLYFWGNILASLACICGAALAAGLTMGLTSLEPRNMQIIQQARLDDCVGEQERERLEKQKDAARYILPLLKDHHLLLVTLLLLNALANEALPVFLDQLVSPFVAVLLAVTFVLLCGEILPSAVFTGPSQLTIASTFVPCVRVLLIGLYVIAKPIAVALDKGLPHKSAEEELYSRPMIRAILSLHSQVSTCLPNEGCGSRRTLMGTGSTTTDIEAQSFADLHDSAAPIDALEVQLCFGILDMGETQVAEYKVFQSLRRCSSAFHATVQSMNTGAAAGAAAAAGAEAVVVFRSLDLVKWPIEVPLDELVGVLRLPELLTAEPTATLEDLCIGRAVVHAHDTITDALSAIADECGTPCGFALVIQRKEFIGLLDGEEVLAGLLRPLEEGPPLIPGSQALSHEAAEAVQEAMASRMESMDGPSSVLSPVRGRSCQTPRDSAGYLCDVSTSNSSIPSVAQANGGPFSRQAASLSGDASPETAFLLASQSTSAATASAPTDQTMGHAAAPAVPSETAPASAPSLLMAQFAATGENLTVASATQVVADAIPTGAATRPAALLAATAMEGTSTVVWSHSQEASAQGPWRGPPRLADTAAPAEEVAKQAATQQSGEVELQAMQALAEYEAGMEAGEAVDEEQRWAALATQSVSRDDGSP